MAVTTDPVERVLKLENERPFLDGPGEFIVKKLIEHLSSVKQWKALFVSFDPYLRMDYAIRSLPALRVYCEYYSKEYESWWVNGVIILEVIWPANLRRDQLEQFPSTVSAAMLQQFRSPTFFESMCEAVPGLNELGKQFVVQKNLGFEWGENIVPLTRFEANFRLDLEVWTRFMESQGRTKDTPFEITLGNLERIVSEIQALNDEGEEEVSLSIDQTV